MAFCGQIFDFDEAPAASPAPERAKKVPKRRAQDAAPGPAAAPVKHRPLSAWTQGGSGAAAAVTWADADADGGPVTEAGAEAEAEDCAPPGPEAESPPPGAALRGPEGPEKVIPSVQVAPIPLAYDRYRKSWALSLVGGRRMPKATEWPQSSDVCCLWCCHAFDTVPVPLPVHYDPKTLMFHIRGSYCSWACAKAHALHSHGESGMHIELLAMLRRRVEGKHLPIKPAPDRGALKMFGGRLTIEDFRRASATECKHPMITVNMTLQQYGLRFAQVQNKDYFSINNGQAGQQAGGGPSISSLGRDKANGRDLSFSNISIKKNEPLKLKRGKPPLTNKGKTVLEKVLGIAISA